MKNSLKNIICTRCILDTTVPEIVFDEKGVCNYCKLHDLLNIEYPKGAEQKELLRKILNKIKDAGKNKKYDCVVGVSGGTDSSYTLYQSVKNGLRPLAVHFDNGWNSEIAVSNIKNICTKLNVDLYTYVVDWEEFKDLQISFLKASVPDAEIPTDVGIHSILIKIAKKEGIKYVLNGHSFRAEGISPVGWTYMDGLYISSVQKKLGRTKLKTYPNFTLFDLLRYNLINKVQVIPFLNYIDYTKEEAKKILSKELGWKDYGGHHHESTFTYFFQSYYLPKKFNIDKRKTELSALIREGYITRGEGLREIKNKPYLYDKKIVEYTISKLGLTQNEFEKIMRSVNKSFKDYRTYYPLMKTFRYPIKAAYKLNIIPKLLYLKFSILLS